MRQPNDQVKNELQKRTEPFSRIQKTLDQELVALRGKYERLDERLVRVEQKLGFAGV